MRTYLKMMPLAVIGIGSIASVAEGQTPLDASATDRASMGEWYRFNELCRGSSDAETIKNACPKRDRAEKTLEARGWCWAYADTAVFPVDYRWHHCSQKTLPLSVREVKAGFASRTMQEGSAPMRSATIARDAGGFSLGMSIGEAASLSSLESIGGYQYQTTKNGIRYDFSITPLGRIYRVDSVQLVRRFAIDDMFLRALAVKLSAKYGKPTNATPETFKWSLIETVKRTGGDALPFETNWASANVQADADGVSIHIKLIDFRILWNDEAASNRASRDKAINHVAF
ncbi:hypothetical protein [Sphingomonas bacterium]|uniref:hypothetical protein n=1 Tax=Sphingomonas bacterium TaxID=1895847 RepID=UPI0015751FBB|nr:hypothetical protein [Sphingomonas bacterium]